MRWLKQSLSLESSEGELSFRRCWRWGLFFAACYLIIIVPCKILCPPHEYSIPGYIIYYLSYPVGTLYGALRPHFQTPFWWSKSGQKTLGIIFLFSTDIFYFLVGSVLSCIYAAIKHRRFSVAISVTLATVVVSVGLAKIVVPGIDKALHKMEMEERRNEARSELEHDPDDVRNIFLLGLNSAGEEMEKCFLRVVEIEASKDGPLYYTYRCLIDLALLYQSQEKHQKAESYYRKFLATNPDFSDMVNYNCRRDYLRKKQKAGKVEFSAEDVKSLQSGFSNDKMMQERLQMEKQMAERSTRMIKRMLGRHRDRGDPMDAMCKEMAKRARATADDSAGNIDVLASRIKSKDGSVRLKAAQQLSIIKSKRSVDVLVEALRVEQEPNPIMWICLSLQNLEALALPEVFLILTEKLSASNTSVQREAIRVLGRIENPDVVDPILEMASSDDKHVRQDVAKVLGQVCNNCPGREKEIIVALSKHLNDDDAYLRLQAVSSLGRINTKEAIDIISKHTETEKDDSVRKAATRALGETN